MHIILECIDRLTTICSIFLELELVMSTSMLRFVKRLITWVHEQRSEPAVNKKQTWSQKHNSIGSDPRVWHAWWFNAPMQVSITYNHLPNLQSSPLSNCDRMTRSFSSSLMFLHCTRRSLHLSYSLLSTIFPIPVNRWKPSTWAYQESHTHFTVLTTSS